MSSFISLNWAGFPLRPLSPMTALTRGTNTIVGLTVKAVQLKGYYSTKVLDAQMATMNSVATSDLSTMELCLSAPSGIPSKSMKLFFDSPSDMVAISRI
jgi:hypothetical protein